MSSAWPYSLFEHGELPEVERQKERNYKSITVPLWTRNKAKLIEEYIRLFTYVTKHGAYIDGFAAPQRRSSPEMCSAKRVMEVQPARVREMWLCDIDPKGVAQLERMKSEDQTRGRRIHVLPGDFNTRVHTILASGRITERTATFALLDQRSTECDWSTVQALARHKSSRKIELFYFVATGWLGRALAATRRPESLEKLARWWGNDGWNVLRGLGGLQQAELFADRFRNELGYSFVYPFAIHNASVGGRMMYCMLHATDHPEASPLMFRAYRKAAGRSDWRHRVEQRDLEELWGRAGEPT